MASDTADRSDAILATLDISDEVLGLAETCIRRLANRHGHEGESCPDPEAHKRDVESMSNALRAAGLATYEHGGEQTYWGIKPRRGEASSEENTA